MNRYRMFFLQTCTAVTQNMHQKLTEHDKSSMQVKQLQNKTSDEFLFLFKKKKKRLYC